MSAGLVKGVVLDLGRMDQHLVAAAVVAVLSRLEPPAVVVHVQEVAVDRNFLRLRSSCSR